MTSAREPLDDDGALRALFDRMCAAWTAGRATDYGACFTEDCDYVSFDGYRAHGRAAVVDAHHRLFTGVLYRSALTGSVERLYRLGPDVAREYDALWDDLAADAARNAEQGAPPRQVARAIVREVEAPRPRPRRLVGRDAHLAAAIAVLPGRLRDRLLAARH